MGNFRINLNMGKLGGSPGLEVMGDDSCSNRCAIYWMDIFSH